MKKSRKLHLSRETLRRLDSRVLVDVGGAAPQQEYKDTGNGQDDPIYTGPFYAGCPSYGNYCTVGCGTASC